MVCLVLSYSSFQCINRNILECKVISFVVNPAAARCINRNILECKVGIALQNWFCRSVLIETYWNVKFISNADIDLGDMGINRNILECKVGYYLKYIRDNEY